MHAIESKENFSKEVSGMLEKLKAQIDTYSNSVSQGGSMKDSEAISKLNILKKYEFTMRDLPVTLEGLDQQGWEIKKDELQDTFLKAQHALKEVLPL